MTLRSELQRITDEYTGLAIGEQIGHVESLRDKWPHGIELVQTAMLGQPDTFRFNCSEYALDVIGAGDVFRYASKPDVKLVGSDFMIALLPQLTPLPAPVDGSLVVWSRDGRPAHAGVHAGGGVRSK